MNWKTPTPNNLTDITFSYIVITTSLQIVIDIVLGLWYNTCIEIKELKK